MQIADRFPRKSKQFFLHGIGLLGVLALIGLRILAVPVTLEPDSQRYVVMGLNIADFGTLTGQGYQPHTPPQPGLGQGGLLTALEIAIAARLHEPTRQSLICFARHAFPATDCTGPLAALKWLYAAELAIFLFALYRIALLVFTGDAVRAWLAVLVALPCRELWQYSRFVLGEPLFIAMAGLFLWAWLAAWKQPQRWTGWLLAGLVLGLTVLVKPSWLALGPLTLLLLFAFVWRHIGRRDLALTGMSFAIGFALPTAAFLLRNYIQLGHWIMSDPNYLIGNLSHRFAFNMMSWREWGMGWIYYLPDFGDNIAVKLFGTDAVARLGWGPASLYVYGRDVLQVAMQKLSPSEAQQQILQAYALNDPLKNIAVTALLAFRGLFIGGKWGLYGLLASVVTMIWLLRGEQRRLWLLLLLPALIMAGVNAQLSVSIVRYNLALVPAYALALAAALHACGAFVAAKTMRRDRI
ncbi:MAG: glycosyltransferase family 39 protein [Ferrovibrio sp.]|uniref:glycosyltransferase family 39 protein n=1 Tax=Ferrovibrio sp. TaxID=1917215 RepID=UPI002635FCB8|nr:glycosyltransferase family 39 protein [Ferrovibrio sp.]MCW0233885.1 glycosyltransferase family 39 protein [Ferrovibrio sp.]